MLSRSSVAALSAAQATVLGGRRARLKRIGWRTLIGERLGHFRITARLGAGGMGEVYRAEDTRIGRVVAIRLGTSRELFRLGARAAGNEGQLDLLARSDDAFDVTPDGERFVMVRPATIRGQTPRMVLVQNWRRELPQR